MGLVSAACSAANAAYAAGLNEVVDTVGRDDGWTDRDQEAFHQHLLVNAPSRLDTDVLCRDEAVEALLTLDMQRSRLVAEQHRVIVALAGGTPRVRQVTVWDEGEGEDDVPRTVALTDEAVEVVSTALRRSPDTVRRQLSTARTLAQLPRTMAAVESGAISSEHAEQIARVAHDLPAEMRVDYEESVLPRVAASETAMTPSEVGSLARRVRARLDAAGEEARRRVARRHQDVRIWAEDDGLACLQARIPLVDAARVHAALDARARQLPYDPDDSIGVRRAMALVAAVCGGGVTGGGAAGSGATGGAAAAVEVQIHVTCGLSTVLGLADDPAMVAMPTGTPEPITANALRALLCDPRVPVTLRRLVTDPMTGQLLDRGRTRYRVPDSLRAFLVARDGTCRFPGCPRRADRCDIDHIEPWEDGGGTDRANLMPLCRRHHVVKTHGEWSITAHRDDGTVVWRSPDGRPIVTQPWSGANLVPS